MTRYEEALAGLKSFQRATVEYAFRRMFDEGQRRFLVADEVGLGKTLVARGVVARALERLEADGVKRIDVVYICSNREIANQNIRKLNVLPGEAFDRAERLTLLPLYVHDLKRRPRTKVKHNFVSFTPGTMPDRGNRTGSRACLALRTTARLLGLSQPEGSETCASGNDKDAQLVRMGDRRRSANVD